MSMKTCSKCGAEKVETEFSKDRHTKDGLRTRCRACMSGIWKADYAANPEYYKQRSKDWNSLNPEKTKRIRKHSDLMQCYGLSLAEYERMLKEQEGNCAICSQPMSPPCVDHCHLSNKIRALLCAPCNTALGGLKDSPALCFLAASYLQKFST